MNVVLWVLAGILAAAFLAAGGMKAVVPREKLAPNMGWVEDFSPDVVRMIGTVEVLGAIGLILPALTGVASVLTPVAAAGIAVTMIGAIIVHVRRGETGQIAAPAVLLVVSALVAILRFGPYSF